MNLVLRDGLLYESVLLTVVENGYYASPVGFVKNGDIVRIKVYKNTVLHSIISKTHEITLNIVFDPLIFAYFAFKKEFGIDESKMKEFVVVENNTPRLRGCVGYIVARWLRTENFDEYTIFDFRIESIETCKDAVIEPFSRCYAQLIESTIYASKVKFANDNLLRERCVQAFNYFFEVARKTCCSDYGELLAKLKRMVDEWLRKS